MNNVFKKNIVDKYIIDAFITDKTYIHFMPGYFYNLNYDDILIKDNHNNIFNIVFFIEIDDIIEKNINIIVPKLDYTTSIKIDNSSLM